MNSENKENINQQELQQNNSQDEKDQLFEPEQEIPESEKTLEKALEYKEAGNNFFKEQLFDDAIEQYEKAILYCPSEEKKQQAVCFSNLGICYLKKNDYDSVIEYTTKAIQLDETFKKPYLNRIAAFEKSDREEDALEDLKTLEKLDPNDKEIKARIYIMNKKVEESQERKKKEVLSGLKDLGNTILGKFGLSIDNFKLNQNENGSYNISFNK